MKVKTFHALSMQDALREIKEELGPDAIILSSKEVREDGRMVRLFNRPILEVMAACEQPPLQGIPSIRTEVPHAEVRRHANPQTAPASSGQGFQETLQAILNPASLRVEPSRGTGAVRPAVPRSNRWKRTRLRELRAELCELSRRLTGEAQTVPSTSEPDPAVETRLRHSLTQQGMSQSTAESLSRDVSRIAGPGGSCWDADIGAALQHTLARRITVDTTLFHDGRRAVVLLLGPSGAGKTSAVAKLAARCRREWNRAVAVVAFEGSGSESHEPLRQYARELGIPFAPARSARQLAEGVSRYPRADLFVIDLPSIESGGHTQGEALCRLLGDGWDITTHLVVSASSGEPELHRLAEQASRLPSLRWFFTRVDDTESFGAIVERGCHDTIPLSYWSVGNRVPDDIEPVSLERLAESLMGQRQAVASGPVPQPSAPSQLTDDQETTEVCLHSSE